MGFDMCDHHLRGKRLGGVVDDNGAGQVEVQHAEVLDVVAHHLHAAVAEVAAFDHLERRVRCEVTWM